MRKIFMFLDAQKYERIKNKNNNSAKPLIIVKIYKFITKYIEYDVPY
jgi:hypothetical protein